MNRRVVALRVGAAACLAAIGLVWWPAPASAEGEAEVGWWYRLSGESGPASGTPAEEPAEGAPPATAPPAPVPFPTVPVGGDDPPAAPAPAPAPAVPEGGIYVANDVFGPVAISAVRLHVGQVGNSQLTLRFADGASGAGMPIVACPLLEGFQAVSNGAWRDRPAHDCARATATGSVAGDGTLSFQLSEAFQVAGQQTLDVVILPVPGDGTPFSAPFQPVTPDAFQTIGPAPVRTTSTTSPRFSTDPDAPAAAFSPPSRSSAPVRPQPGAAPTTATTVAPTPGDGGGESAVQPVVDVLEDRTWARWAATAILAAMAVTLLAASNGRIPALAGLRTGPVEKGIGRFARHRDGPPPALT